ncbi:hypothetical protein QL285_041795 [Trifolium repens]|nr:hypothetical protein QL285_041795 [Trifolium repens]
MVEDDEISDARVLAIQARMERLEHSIKSFVPEFRQLLRAEMVKHLGYVPMENLCSGRGMLPLIDGINKCWETKFETKMTPKTKEAEENNREKVEMETIDRGKENVALSFMIMDRAGNDRVNL